MSIYNHTYASLVRFCQDFITNNPGYSGLQFIDFDTAPTLTEYPDNDLIGISSFELEEDEGMFHVTAMLGVSTTPGDLNYFRLREMAGKVFELLKPTAGIKLYNATSGTVIGQMKCKNGTAVMPIVRSAGRPALFIGFHAGCDKARQLLAP